jgi:hypothetical protein
MRGDGMSDSITSAAIDREALEAEIRRLVNVYESDHEGLTVPAIRLMRGAVGDRPRVVQVVAAVEVAR